MTRAEELATQIIRSLEGIDICCLGCHFPNASVIMDHTRKGSRAAYELRELVSADAPVAEPSDSTVMRVNEEIPFN